MVGKTILIHYNSTGTTEEVTIKSVSPSGKYFNDGYLWKEVSEIESVEELPVEGEKVEKGQTDA